MPRTSLPEVSFQSGIRLQRWIKAFSFQTPRELHELHVIGRLSTGGPFLLIYNEGGRTHWESPANLTGPIRQKILNALRQQVRLAASLPAWMVDHDLKSVDRDDLEGGHDQALALVNSFRTEIWERDTLGLGPWVTLMVPFADKDQAKALGAKWDAESKTWRVRQQADMSAFASWLAGAHDGEG